MAGSAKKKCFATVPALRRLDPQTLIDFLMQFPAYVGGKGLALPAGPEEDGTWKLDYELVRDVCMATDVPDDMNTVLFLASKLGTQKGWEEVQEEAQFRGVKLDFPRKNLTHYDLAMKAWLQALPDHGDLLEESYARVRIHGKSTYSYYRPMRDLRKKYREPTGAVLDGLRLELAEHFVREELAREGSVVVKVLVYDYDREVWFLVRYPGQPVRHDAVADDGQDKDVFFTPGEYDAVVYHKRYGDLRLNTNRKREHAAYRMAFGHALVDSVNAFDPKSAVVTLDPLKGKCRPIFRVDDVPELGGIRVHEVSFYCLERPGLRQVWHSDGDDLFTSVGTDGHLLPGGTDTILYAKFKYRLKDSDKWHSLTVHTGKNLRYERDGDSVVVEQWLRKRGFVADVLGVHKNG